MVDELGEFFAFTFVQVADDGDVPDLLIGKFAMGAVYLGKDVAGIDKKDAVILFGTIEKP
jgi:hypothetical protein